MKKIVIMIYNNKFFISIFLLIIILRVVVIEVYPVDGSSMEPNFYNEDTVLVDKQFYKIFGIDRFNVMIFETEIYGERHLLIKRVIAFENETVEVRNGVLYINGEPDLTYASLDEETNDFGPFTVPVDSYFVMGDNRGNSLDSRRSEIGFVNQDAIIGINVLRYNFEVV